MANGYDWTATIAPGASVTKGLIWLASTSTVDFTLVELEISMDGGTSNFWPKVNLILWTGAFTAPTGGTTLTINKATAAGQARPPVTTGKLGTFTAEPTGGTSVTRRAAYVPNTMPYGWQWPLQREPLYVPLSSALEVQVVTPASFANNITINGVVEE